MPVKPRASSVRKIARRAAITLLVGTAAYVLFWLVTVVGMLGAHAWAASHTVGGSGLAIAGITHVKQVDNHVWRGSAPGARGYRALVALGVHTVVDLRAEHLSPQDRARPAQAGLRLVSLPVRDGQTPTTAQVDTFLKTVHASDTPVFVHCGAGVGRTGSMTAAYLLRTHQATTAQAAMATLAVGPPSLEQIYYVLTPDDGQTRQPPLVVQIASRILDAPRRIAASL